MNLLDGGWPETLRRQWRVVLLGTVVGMLLAAGVSYAFTVEAHTAALWYHGQNAEGNEDGHPFLSSTDGTNRQGSAAYQSCGGYHSPQSEYIHTHVHRYTDLWYRLQEAHIGSQQTGLAHHDHPNCG